jgi:hypothetical protein
MEYLGKSIYGLISGLTVAENRNSPKFLVDVSHIKF